MSHFIGKDPDTGKDWRQDDKGKTENEMIGWYHRLNGHKFEQNLGDSEGQGSLACCSPWDHKKLDMTEWLNSNNNNPSRDRHQKQELQPYSLHNTSCKHRNVKKMRQQRNIFQTKEQGKTPEEQLSDVYRQLRVIGNLSEKEFRVMIVKMI